MSDRAARLRRFLKLDKYEQTWTGCPDTKRRCAIRPAKAVPVETGLWCDQCDLPVSPAVPDLGDPILKEGEQ